MEIAKMTLKKVNEGIEFSIKSDHLQHLKPFEEKIKNDYINNFPTYHPERLMDSYARINLDFIFEDRIINGFTKVYNEVYSDTQLIEFKNDLIGLIGEIYKRYILSEIEVISE